MATKADVQAMALVLMEISDESESMSVESAMEMLETLTALKKDVAMAISLIETHLCNTLESPREFNGNLYEVKSAGKWRPDHETVKAAVKRQSVVNMDTGEILTPADAVERCMGLLYELYVQPSLMPKVGALSKIGLDKPDIAHYERTGNRISVTPVISS